MVVTTREIDWLAGLFEGEGCSYGQQGKSGFRLSIEMGDEDVLVRAGEILNTRVELRSARKHSRKDGTQLRPMWRVTVSGPSAVGWAMTLYPLLGLRRQEKIRSLIGVWKAGRVIMRPKYRVVVAIETAIEVFATSASGAWETAQAIARETITAKGFKAGKTSVVDIQRIYPTEDRESALDCMETTAKESE